MVKVSLLISVYNVEKYIERCVVKKRLNRLSNQKTKSVIFLFTL